DENGLIIEALAETLTQHHPALIYTIPTFHNPTGINLSAARRAELVALSEEYDFLIVADEVYQLLHYTNPPPPPMSHYNRAGTVLSLGTFSKIMAPGLRLGWIEARPRLLDRLLNSGQVDSGGGLNPFPAAMVHSALDLGLQDDYLAFLQRTYGERVRLMSAALRQHVPTYEFTEPDGGYFIWGRLPETINTEAILPAVRAENVGYLPGNRCAINQGFPNYLRLSFAYYPNQAIEEGVARLAKVIK
ncbi:MAG: PLP-dependent aminotransferase family protein, partial [Anaerolineae bacterium]|nr:PLP-dependent aminotransferase family protein [Anaerolineae bacterium]